MNTLHKNFLSIAISLILILTSNIIGHFAGPFSIEATPFILTIIIALINLPLYQSNFILTVIFNFTLLIINDLFIRYYAGGSHDQVGKAIISIIFAITFYLAIITMIIYSFTTTNEQEIAIKRKKILIKILCILFLSFLTGIIYYYFICDF